MNIEEFRRVLAAFADTPADVDFRQGRVVAQVRDDLIDIALKYSDTEERTLRVIEGDNEYAARTWLLNRVARLPQLADRILTVVTPTAEQSTRTPFVVPRALMSPNLGSGEINDQIIDNAVEALLDAASNPQPGATSVVYITSDAGEGKTTVINRAARLQAERFKRRETQVLIVPIPLNGRAFLTFDDAVIAALVNKLRFNYLYFDAFLQLVRMGVVVPAFDGYEEMLVEGTKGEAVSALGSLVQSLESSGTVYVAARKAFFEYLSLRTQARLLDAIGDKEAEFSRLALQRWDKEQFCQYGRLRKARDPLEVYDTVAARLTPQHPLLTRAVLVRRLYDVAESEAHKPLADLLAANPHDFFFTFVDAIVKREAEEKWLVRVAGEHTELLLTKDEHHSLLSQLSLEMWQSSSTALRYDLLDVVVELFAESLKKGAAATRQIKERVKQHSLLAVDSRGNGVVFDHEDFQNFYLGEGLGQVLARLARTDTQSVLSVNLLSSATTEEAALHVLRVGADLVKVLALLETISKGEAGFSFCKENCGALSIRLLECVKSGVNLNLAGMVFPAGALGGRQLQGVKFIDCHFQPSTMFNTSLTDVRFINCVFERLEVGDQDLSTVYFDSCRVDSLVFSEDEYSFDPQKIREDLAKLGASISEVVVIEGEVQTSSRDLEVDVLDRFLRMFSRHTSADEEGIRTRLGHDLAVFNERVLPKLLSQGVLEEVTWRGKGVQRRYRLAKPLARISSSLEQANGSYERFLESVRR